jgi:hypothetical protein
LITHAHRNDTTQLRLVHRRSAGVRGAVGEPGVDCAVRSWCAVLIVAGRHGHDVTECCEWEFNGLVRLFFGVERAVGKGDITTLG